MRPAEASLAEDDTLRLLRRKIDEQAETIRLLQREIERKKAEVKKCQNVLELLRLVAP